MRKINNVINKKTRVVKSINENKFNLLITPRRWGLTSFLANYVNNLGVDKKILFCVPNIHISKHLERLIYNPNCIIITENTFLNKTVGRRFDYVIFEHFNHCDWIKILSYIQPSLHPDGKIIMASNEITTEIELWFRNYNKIIIKN